MIRWCCYCQRLMGEKAPFDSSDFSHGICAPCEAALERGEALHRDTEPVRALFGRVLASARAGDEASCAGFLGEARALGLGAESILVGMLQPALYRAGLEWEEGRMSPAAERCFTDWCERVFAMLAPAAPAEALDLLILQAPGNAHTVGPRFAAHALGVRGLRVEAVASAVPLAEAAGLAQRHRPRFIGISCALSAHVPAATDLVARLRARLGPELTCRYVLSGFAFRFAGGVTPPPADAGVEVALDLDYFGGATPASAAA